MAEPKPKKKTYGGLYYDAYNMTNRANLDFSFELAMQEAKSLEERKMAALKAYQRLKAANEKDIFDKKIKLARLQHSVNKQIQDSKKEIRKQISGAYDIDDIGLTAVGETMARKVGAGTSTTRTTQEAITAIGGTGAGRSNFQRAIIGRNLLQLAEAAHLRGGRTAGTFPRRQIEIIIKSGLGLKDDLSKSIQEIEDEELKRQLKTVGTTVKRGKIKVFEEVDTDGDGVPDTSKPVIDPATNKQKEVLAPGETIASLQESIQVSEGQIATGKQGVIDIDSKIKELFGDDVDEMLGSERIIERARDIYDRKFKRLTPEQERAQEEFRLTQRMSKTGKANYKLLDVIADNDPYIDRLVEAESVILPSKDEVLPGYVKVANIIMLQKKLDPTLKADDIISRIKVQQSGLTPAEIQKGKALALRATMRRANPNFSPTPPLPKTTQQKVAQAFLEAAETPKEKAKTQNMFGIDDNIFDIVEGKSDVSGVPDSIGNEPQGENPVLKFFSELFEPKEKPAKTEVKKEEKEEQKTEQQQLVPVPLEEQDIPEEFKPVQPQGVSEELLQSQGVEVPELPFAKGTRLGETGTFYYVYDGVDADGNPKINIFYKKGAKKDKPIDPQDKLLKAAKKRAKEKYEKALKEKK